MSKRKEETWTSINVTEATKNRLKNTKVGTLGDTYDSLLNKILDEVEKK